MRHSLRSRHRPAPEMRVHLAVLQICMAFHSPQHFKAERLGCTAAARTASQLNDLYARVLGHILCAARRHGLRCSCFARRAGASKRGAIIGHVTGSPVRLSTFDCALRLTAGLHLPCCALLCGGGPHCLVCCQNQPSAFQTCGGDAQLRQHRPRGSPMRGNCPRAIASGEPYDFGTTNGRAIRALFTGIDKHRAGRKVLRAVVPQPGLIVGRQAPRPPTLREARQNCAERLGSGRSTSCCHVRRQRRLYCEGLPLRAQPL